jgi:hypothetical protein
MSLSHSQPVDINIDESISFEMHLSGSNDVNFSDDFSDTSSTSRYTNGEIKPRTGDINIIIQYHIKLNLKYIVLFSIVSFL